MNDRSVVNAYVRRRAREFASCRLSLRDFNRWLVPFTWDYRTKLVCEILHQFSLYDDGRMNKTELRQKVKSLVG